MDIKPKEGLGSLFFGYTPDEIITIWGKPSSVVQIREDGMEWLYDRFETTLFFDNENNQLSAIETDSREAKLHGIRVVGQEKKQIIADLANCDVKEHVDIDMENRVFFPELQLSLLFEYGEVSSVLWST